MRLNIGWMKTSALSYTLQDPSRIKCAIKCLTDYLVKHGNRAFYSVFPGNIF